MKKKMENMKEVENEEQIGCSRILGKRLVCDRLADMVTSGCS